MNTHTVTSRLKALQPTPKSTLSIPIIILHYNSPKKIEACIKSFMTLSCSLKPFFIVIDSCSTSDNLAHLEEILQLTGAFKQFNGIANKNECVIDLEKIDGVFYSSDTNLGYSCGNNLGFRMALQLGFKYGILANPDTQACSDDDIVELIEVIKSKDDIVAVYPQILGPDNKTYGNNQGPFPAMSYWYLLNVMTGAIKVTKHFTAILKKVEKRRSLKRNSGRYYSIYASIGCLIGIDVEKFLSMEGFDEEFFLYNEEQVLAERAQKNGFDIVMAMNTTFFHDHLYSESDVKHDLYNESFELFLKKYRGMSKFQITLFRKWSTVTHKFAYFMKNIISIEKRNTDEK